MHVNLYPKPKIVIKASFAKTCCTFTC